MPLRALKTSPLPTSRELFHLPVGNEVQIKLEHRLLTLQQNQAFRWFAQWWWPGKIAINQATMPDGVPIIILMDQSNQAILQLKQGKDGWWRGKQHGVFPIWKTVEQAIEQFTALGEPEYQRYEVQMDEQEAQLQTLDAHGQAHVICGLYQQQ